VKERRAEKAAQEVIDRLAEPSRQNAWERLEAQRQLGGF